MGNKWDHLNQVWKCPLVTSLKFMYLHMVISFIYINLIRLFLKLLILLVCVCKPQSYVSIVIPHWQAFSLDFNLRSHMRTHTGENYHACPYDDCGKRYAHEYKLRAHMRNHHDKVCFHLYTNYSLAVQVSSTPHYWCCPELNFEYSVEDLSTLYSCQTLLCCQI